MLAFIDKIRPPSGKLVRVRITDPTLAKKHGRCAEHVEPGSEIDVSEGEAIKLTDSEKAVRLGTVEDGVFKPYGKAPPRVVRSSYVAEEPPECYKDLPPVFAAAWRKREELRALRCKVRDSEEYRRALGGAVAAGNEAVLQMESSMGRVLSAMEDVRRFDHDALGRLLFECGRHVISEIRSANGVRDELARVAVAIFAQRLAALELSERHILRLFEGSALQQRYILQNLPEHNLCSAGQVHYVDASLEEMAGFTFTARELRQKATELLAQSKGELLAATTTTARKAK